MKKIFVCLFCFLFVFGCTGCVKNKTDLSTICENLNTYTLDVDLDVENKSATVTQNINYINNTKNILKTLKFHLYPEFFEEGATSCVVSSTKLNQAYPNGMSYAEFEIERIKVENKDISPAYEGDYNNILCISLFESLLPEKSVDIQIEFNFTLPNCEHRFGYGENTINLANFYPIACVYENGNFSTNPYNANGDPFYSDVANYNVTIEVNKDYTLATSGEKLNETINESKKTASYSAVVVRDFAIVASNKFEVISSKYKNTTIEYYYFNDESAEKSLQAGVDSIKTFSNLFGDFPYKNFSIVKTDFIYGGMEYPNLIMISEDIDNADDYLNVIIHETAHQWWYAMVGNDEYTLPWLDEALTEFSTVLFYDNNDGYNLTHKEMVDANRANYSTFITVYNDVLGSIDTSMRAVNEYNTEPEYTYCTYVKGVLMYESLYSLIGEKDFYKALTIYFENNKFKNTSSTELISAFEQASGQNLRNFFDSWLKGKVVIR